MDTIDLQVITEPIVIELTPVQPIELTLDVSPIALTIEQQAIELSITTNPIELTLGTGPTGIGIESATIDGDGDLIVTYTNGDVQNAGRAKGDDGDPGRGITNAQITGVDLVLSFDQAPSLVNVGRVVGNDGRGITSVTQPSGPSTAQVNYTSGSPDTINLPAGPAGANGDRYATTSSTSFSIPNNNDQRTFTIGTGLAYTNEQTIIVATTDGSGHHWHGTVDSYNALTGVITATCTGRTGTGTYASWEVNLSGAVGTTGNGIATITQPNGPANFLVTYTNGETQIVTLPNSWINPNENTWADPFMVLETTQWVPSTSAGTTPAIAVPADTQESGAVQFGVASVNSTSTIVRVNAQYSLIANMVMGCMVRIGTLPDATNDYSYVMSAWQGASVDPSRWANQIGIRLVRSGGSVFWQAICRATTEATFTSTTPVTANTTYSLQWQKIGSTVTFYINGVLFATLNSSVPSVAGANIIHRLWKIAGTGAVTSQIYQHYERMNRTVLIGYATI